MRPLTKVICAAYIDRKDWVAAFHEFLISYRVTPHSSTNVPPADLMLQRRICYSIPGATNKLNRWAIVYLSSSRVKIKNLFHSTHTHIVSLLKKVRCL